MLANHLGTLLHSCENNSITGYLGVGCWQDRHLQTASICMHRDLLNRPVKSRDFERRKKRINFISPVVRVFLLSVMGIGSLGTWYIFQVEFMIYLYLQHREVLLTYCHEGFQWIFPLDILDIYIYLKIGMTWSLSRSVGLLAL